LLAAAVAAVVCVPASAQQGVATDESVARAIDAFNPYLSVGYGNDSNIYRLDDAVDPIGDSRSDQYGTVAAGFGADLSRSLQRYELYGEINHTFFNEHDDLDYTGSTGGAIWHWALGQPSSGTLGVTHVRALRDFSNQAQPDVRVKDVRMENKILGSADVDVVGPWALGIRGYFAKVTFSETDRLDLRRFMTGASAKYTSKVGSEIGIDAEWVEGDYDETPLADYREYNVGPTLDWKFTERSTIHAKVAYTNRDQADPLREDYDGIVGRVSFNFDNADRNGLKVVAYRELSNLGDEILEYATVTGIEIEPRWQLRQNFELRVNAGYEQRDFNRDLEAELLGLDPNRTDDVVTAGAFVDWQVHRNIKLSFGYDMQKRDSTRELQDYDFNRFEIRVTGSL
jgi:hypothetical protein